MLVSSLQPFPAPLSMPTCSCRGWKRGAHVLDLSFSQRWHIPKTWARTYREKSIGNSAKYNSPWWKGRDPGGKLYSPHLYLFSLGRFIGFHDAWNFNSHSVTVRWDRAEALKVAEWKTTDAWILPCVIKPQSNRAITCVGTSVFIMQINSMIILLVTIY